MDYIEFVIAKAALIVFIAFWWGVYCGFTGNSMQPGQRDTRVEKEC